MCENHDMLSEFNKLIISGDKINPDSDWVGRLVNKHKLDVDIVIKTDVLPENDKLSVRLLPHQVRDIIAMVQLETKRGIVHDNNIIYTRTGVLSEPFGSGKTFIIMGLVAYKPIPEQYKEIYYMSFDVRPEHINPREDYICNRIRPYRPSVPSGILVKRTVRRIIKPTLVFCGTSVALQWANTIQKFSNFKYLLIVHVSGVIKLNKLLEDPDTTELDSYDFIIVKNGVITGVFDYKGYNEYRNQKKTRYIFNIVSNITRNNHGIWSRLIIDDFDTINLPNDCGLVSALFTWVVSGSKRSVGISNISYHSGTSLIRVLDYSDYNFTSITHDRKLWNTFNVSCSNQFTEACVNIGIPKFYLYDFINKDDKTIGLISSLGSCDIVEMLNGDAIETAAETAGIKCTSVIEIFEIILGKNHIKYKNAVELEVFINDNLNFSDLPSVKDNTPNSYTRDDLYNKRPIKYNYPNLHALLPSELDICKSIKLSSGVALQRVKDNISEGDCGICNGDLDDEDTIISKCCGIIQCSICGVQTSLRRQSCANCRQKILLHDVVFINQNFDLNKIVSDDIQYQTEELSTQKQNDVKEKTKIDVLIDIINTQNTHPRKQVNINIHNLLVGTKELPTPTRRSFIVFASYDETLESIIKRFQVENISYRRLEGTAAQISHTVDDFNNMSFQVLLLRSAKDCAGLNLQSATDLVFIHKILNRDIEGQALGRIQRYGRKYSANIHYLLYKNEHYYFNFR